MPTIQVWLKEADIERLEGLRRILAKYYRPDYPYYVGDFDELGYIFDGTNPIGRKRPKLTNSYVLRFALQDALQNQQAILREIHYDDPSVKK